jgi:hypothetical protein
MHWEIPEGTVGLANAIPNSMEHIPFEKLVRKFPPFVY